MCYLDVRLEIIEKSLTPLLWKLRNDLLLQFGFLLEQIRDPGPHARLLDATCSHVKFLQWDAHHPLLIRERGSHL